MRIYLIFLTSSLLYWQVFSTLIFVDILFMGIILCALLLCKTQPNVLKISLVMSIWCLYRVLVRDWYTFDLVPFQFIWNGVGLTEDKVRPDYLYCYFYVYYYGSIAWYSYFPFTLKEKS